MFSAGMWSAELSSFQVQAGLNLDISHLIEDGVDICALALLVLVQLLESLGVFVSGVGGLAVLQHQTVAREF
jgi:hypothetical protein